MPATQAGEVIRYCRKYWTLILHGAELRADVIKSYPVGFQLFLSIRQLLRNWTDTLIQLGNALREIEIMMGEFTRGGDNP
jgi:hypothetical protein